MRQTLVGAVLALLLLRSAVGARVQPPSLVGHDAEEAALVTAPSVLAQLDVAADQGWFLGFLADLVTPVAVMGCSVLSFGIATPACAVAGTVANVGAHIVGWVLLELGTVGVHIMDENNGGDSKPEKLAKDLNEKVSAIIQSQEEAQQSSANQSLIDISHLQQSMTEAFGTLDELTQAIDDDLVDIKNIVLEIYKDEKFRNIENIEKHIRKSWDDWLHCMAPDDASGSSSSLRTTNSTPSTAQEGSCLGLKPEFGATCSGLQGPNCKPPFCRWEALLKCQGIRQKFDARCMNYDEEECKRSSKFCTMRVPGLPKVCDGVDSDSAEICNGMEEKECLESEDFCIWRVPRSTAYCTGKTAANDGFCGKYDQTKCEEMSDFCKFIPAPEPSVCLKSETFGPVQASLDHLGKIKDGLAEIDLVMMGQAMDVTGRVPLDILKLGLDNFQDKEGSDAKKFVRSFLQRMAILQTKGAVLIMAMSHAPTIKKGEGESWADVAQRRLGERLPQQVARAKILSPHSFKVSTGHHQESTNHQDSTADPDSSISISLEDMLKELQAGLDNLPQRRS
jgi:hypothetical protein